jgi:hypothetical protein
MESPPLGTIIPTAAPAISPAPIPIQNPVHNFIFSHSFFGLELVWPEEDEILRRSICQIMPKGIY